MTDSPAKVEKTADSVTAEIGGKAVIECLFTGNPVPTVTWYRGNTRLQDDSRIQIESQDDRSTLSITKAHFRDEDEYKCVVANDGGQDTCLIKLTIDDADDEDVDPKTFDLPTRDKVYLATDKKFEQKYDSLQELGKGKFGVVKKVKHKETGEVLAAKFIKTSAESKKEVLGEIEMMNHLHSRRLIYLADAYERPGEMIVIMELVSGGELFEKICQDDNLTEKEVIRYMRQILQGVEHMHRKSMVHLDLKPENVLCVVRPDGKEDLKLIDFGMAHIIEKGKELKLACGTPEFVAPEVITYEPIHISSDMWSIGVIAYVLLSGLSPFMGDDDNETIMNVSTAEWDFEDEAFDVVSDHSKKFIEELLIRDHSKRNDVYHCLNHEWLKKGKTMEAKKLSTDNLKKFLARRRWQKTSNALRALSRLGSLGIGGGGGGGLLGKVTGKKQETHTEGLKPRPSAHVSLTGRRSPTLTGRRTVNNGVPAGPPKFVHPLKNCEIVSGSAARFQCQVTGNPEPDVEWYKDGKKLSESKQLTFLYDENDNCKLIITEGTSRDAGEYKVTAVNPHGQVSCSAQLIIKDQPESGGSGSEASGSEASDYESEEEDEGKGNSIKNEKITNIYTIKEELGKGRFGVVCKCVRKKDGKEFAAKFIKCAKAQEKDDVKHEVEIMQLIRHKTLLTLADAFETGSEFILVMELVTGGELFEKVVEEEFISENEVIHYMKQIMQGVKHMHSKNVLHLDLKPENIMIVRPNSKRIKLIDFGLARKYNPKENLKVMFGTPEFVAPEVLTYDRITPATDLWSVGVIAYVLLSGLSPFMGDNDAETLANVQTAEWDFDDEVFDDISDDAKEFISKVLVLKSSKRITVKQCLEHPWLTVERERGKINTNRLKAFTARRKWKKALTAIRSTNFLSKLLGSRGTEEGGKQGGGGGGLLARVKAMHASGVQAPESAPAASPFLSPASAAEPKPAERTPSTEKKVASTPSSTTPAKTPNGVPKPDSKSSKLPESKSNEVTSNSSRPSALKDNVTKPPSEKNDSKTPVSNDISKKETKSPASKDSISKDSKESRTPSKTISNNDKTSEPSSTRSTSRTPKGAPGKGKLPQWPPPPKERPQKREIADLVERYANEGMPLIPGNPDDYYSIQEEIGRGKFAVVKKCINRESEEPFAAKLVKFDDDEEKETAQEFDIHRTLEHPNIVTLYSGFIVQRYIVLILDLLEKTNALTYLASKSKVTEDDVADIIKNILEALEYLHNQNIIHLDLRPANFMVSKQHVKLIDFGSARLLRYKHGEVGAIVGNIEFTAPEMLSFEPVNTSTDMWSLGVTTYLLLGAQLPFIAKDDNATAEAIKKGSFFFDEDLFPSTTHHAKDFIKSLICKFSNKRMDASTAKAHDWLSSSFAGERRKALTAEPDMLKSINQDLVSEEDEEQVSASCVLRTFQQEPYDSPDDSSDDDDES